MKRRFAFAVLATLAALLVAGEARAQKVKVDYDKKASFAGYKSYRWAPLDEREAEKVKRNPLWVDPLLRAADAELHAKGMALEPQGSGAGALVFSHRLDYHARKTAAVGAAPGQNSNRGLTGEPEGGQGYTELTFELEAIDAATQKTVWKGTVVTELPDKSRRQDFEEERPDKILPKAVKKLLDKWPPR